MASWGSVVGFAMGFLIGRVFDWVGAAENGCTFFDWRGLIDAFKCAGEVGAGYTHFLLVIVECESGGAVFGVVVGAVQFDSAGLVAVVCVGFDDVAEVGVGVAITGRESIVIGCFSAVVAE